MAAYGRVLAWQVWERLVRRPLTITTAEGLRLRCYPHSTSASGVIYCEHPEWKEKQFVLDVLRPGDAFIDVGANIGVYTLLACSCPDVSVWAFEPSPATMRRLRENVVLNGLQSRVVLEQRAVGSTAGLGYLTKGNDSTNRLVSCPDVDDHTERVETTTLDDAIPSSSEASFTVLKIDVEGAEHSVLSGASRVIETARPVIIVEKNDFHVVAEYLQRRRYHAYDYDPVERRLAEVRDWSASGQNALFIYDVDIVRARLEWGNS